MMTKAGVERDLPNSPYVVVVSYEIYDIKYYFSSASIMENFKRQLANNRKKINDSLSYKFRVRFEDMEAIYDVKLYYTLESRGFYIKLNGKPITNPGLIIFEGGIPHVAPEEKVH